MLKVLLDSLAFQLPSEIHTNTTTINTTKWYKEPYVVAPVSFVVGVLLTIYIQNNLSNK